MITPEELRIGNCIYYRKYGEGERKIIQIKIGDLSKIAGLNQEYEEIPITPEIMLKCGFEKMNAGWLKNQLSFHDKDKETYFGDYGTRNGKFKFKYLHQLQNLYFALTGEELEVTI